MLSFYQPHVCVRLPHPRWLGSRAAAVGLAVVLHAAVAHAQGNPPTHIAKAQAKSRSRCLRPPFAWGSSRRATVLPPALYTHLPHRTARTRAATAPAATHLDRPPRPALRCPLPGIEVDAGTDKIVCAAAHLHAYLAAAWNLMCACMTLCAGPGRARARVFVCVCVCMCVCVCAPARTNGRGRGVLRDHGGGNSAHGSGLREDGDNGVLPRQQGTVRACQPRGCGRVCARVGGCVCVCARVLVLHLRRAQENNRWPGRGRGAGCAVQPRVLRWRRVPPSIDDPPPLLTSTPPVLWAGVCVLPHPSVAVAPRPDVAHGW